MKTEFGALGAVTLPDFFIVGAPKGGTTSLHYYLQEHPQVFMPKTEGILVFQFHGP